MSLFNIFYENGLKILFLRYYIPGMYNVRINTSIRTTFFQKKIFYLKDFPITCKRALFLYQRAHREVKKSQIAGTQIYSQICMDFLCLVFMKTIED